MKYIALLRGINVGKKNRIDMKRLKERFESLGYTNVSTYLNTGNVFFETERTRIDELRVTVEKAIKKKFGFDVPVLIKTEMEIKKIVEVIPKNWKNDSMQKSDVAYLFPEIDSEKTIDELPVKKKFMNIAYVKGAIYWNIDRKNYNKSHLNKIIGHKLYQLMTLRNINTVRKLSENCQISGRNDSRKRSKKDPKKGPEKS